MLKTPHIPGRHPEHYYPGTECEGACYPRYLRRSRPRALLAASPQFGGHVRSVGLSSLCHLLDLSLTWNFLMCLKIYVSVIVIYVTESLFITVHFACLIIYNTLSILYIAS